MQSNRFFTKQTNPGGYKRKIFLFVLMSIALNLLTVSAQNTASKQINLSLTNATLKELFNAIEQASNFRFLYDAKDVNTSAIVTAIYTNTSIDRILREKLSDYAYEIKGNQIVVRSRQTAEVTSAQTPVKRITGAVTDAAGEPIPGATVLVKNTSNGTATDNDGNFTLNNVPENATLQISYVGYKTQDINVLTEDGDRFLIIKLLEDIEALEEVVVVGYGTQKKVNLTGSVASISSKVLSKRQVGQTSLALQGVASGVTITQRSGQPGVDGGEIRIRGIGTLNNSNPLILVDGLEMGINNLDVNTIESISVLKDAASASIYGSKAANGVILITTKRAEQGKFNITYNGYVAQQRPTDLPKKVNALDHIMLINESRVNAGAGILYSDEQINNWKNLGPTDRDHYPDTDWQKEVLTGSGLQQNHSLTLTGGTDKLRVLASLGYIGQKAIIENVGYERISLRLNTDIHFTKQFSASLDLFLYNGNRNSLGQYASVSTGGASGIGLAFIMMNKLPAVQAMKYSNGLYAEGQNGDNPVANIHEGGFYTEMTTPITGNFSFKWNPVESFWIQTAFSPSISYPQTKSFIKKVSTYNIDGSVFSTLPAKASLSMQSDFNRYLQSRTTANFQKGFNSHNVSAMAGFQYESNYYSGFNAFRDEFLFPEYSVLQSGSVENMRNDGWAGENALLSWFGRINYDYNSKYLFEANIRYDGSSKFAKGNQWGVFPSFSAGWRISEEAFWENLKSIVKNLKIRGSWGKLGNQNISGDYPFSSNIDMGTKYISDDQLIDGAAVLTMNNPDITWETTTMTNAGLDVNLLGKIDMTFEYFYKKTTDILMILNIPGTMGLNPTYQNAGIVENKGFEFNLNYNDRIGNFDYDIGFNLSDVRNKIIDLKGINGTGLVTNREGSEINALYMRRCLGILTEADFNSDGSYKWTRQSRPLAPGDLRFANLNDDDIINAEDQEVLGSTIPRYTFGVSFNGRFKGFDMNLLLQGVGKVDGYVTYVAYPFWSGGTAFETHKDRWTTENQNVNATWPRLYFYDNTNNYLNTDFYLRSAAYLRLKNIQLGYTLPVSLTRKALIENLRVYLSGENLLTFTKFWAGWDPEVSPGQGGTYYPQVKTISLGLDIKF